MIVFEFLCRGTDSVMLSFWYVFFFNLWLLWIVN